MAHLESEKTNQFERAFKEGISKAEAVELRKTSGELRAGLASVEKRQEAADKRHDSMDAAVFKAVQLIGEHLGRIERAIGPAALEAASLPDDPMRIAAKYAPGPYERGAMSMSRR